MGILTPAEVVGDQGGRFCMQAFEAKLQASRQNSPRTKAVTAVCEE